MVVPSASPGIAVVGLACRLPDANSPGELWENALAQRRAFRRLPEERLRGKDYYSADRSTPDATYSMQGAVLAGYEFDRIKYRVVGSTYRSADLAHWLALDVAADALSDAGFADGRGLPKETTGVLVANTLTGEFSRAGLMRHRWPYVRRHVGAALADAGWNEDAIGAFLERLEVRYKAPFESVGEESLAGGLSNTIAGRVCNHFDLKGGGYTVDGACASSLLAVANACASLAAGDLDVALAGGVDLSLDPFEIVGFAKTGALAGDDMRVYDARSEGFWPGEGCAFAVLMRRDDALASGARIYACIRGWGISSDGNGGITRPDEDGQVLALRRAYRKAGCSAAAIAYVEGHGTGTAVGDTTELRALSRVRREADTAGRPAAIGSIKANIGHTKAAAGLAGLLKATFAVHRRILPPATGCASPHPELLKADAPLRILRSPEPWPPELTARAGVSAMGFGGINAHVVVESATAETGRSLSRREHMLGRTPQDGELFLWSSSDAASLRDEVARLHSCAGQLSIAELTDLAAELSRRDPSGSWRAAVVARQPAGLAMRLAKLAGWIEEGIEERLDAEDGVFLSHREEPPRIGFLFPGQGSPGHLDGGIFRCRFEAVAELYGHGPAGLRADGVSTQLAQPAIVRATLAGLRVARALGLEATVGVGHSLGELSALCWAGVWDEATVLRVAAMRGRVMGELGHPEGAMASIEGDAEAVRSLIGGFPVVIAGLNSPLQTVVSGSASAVAGVLRKAAEAGMGATRLPVSHAFHSPLMAAAEGPYREVLGCERFGPPSRTVFSTITGRLLDPGDDLPNLLVRQLTSPVRFSEAIALAMPRCDVLIEVGPGLVLGRLLSHFADRTGKKGEGQRHRIGGNVPAVFSVDAGGVSLIGLLTAVGACFVLGAPVRREALFADRFTRPFPLPWVPRFFANPCESAPQMRGVDDRSSERLGGRVRESAPPSATAHRVSDDAAVEASVESESTGGDGTSMLEVVRKLVAERAELPVDAVHDDSRLLGDLHLNSISVGQLVAEIARRVDLAPPASLTEFATATVEGLAEALEHLVETQATSDRPVLSDRPVGVDTWLRAFLPQWVRVTRSEAANGEWRIAHGAGIEWKLVAPAGHGEASLLLDRLRAADRGLAAASGHGAGPIVPDLGVVVWLPDESPERQYPLLLEGARAVFGRPTNARFVVVQHGPGGGGFARTLSLELGRAHVLVVTVPAEKAEAVEWILEEVRDIAGYREVRFHADGVREEFRLRLVPPAADEDAEPCLGPADVLLVTGGGKGIAAECALELARRSGVRLLLCGRSRPEADEGLASNLARFERVGAIWRYVAADVTDRQAMEDAVRGTEKEWGPVTAILHGAGTNVPKLLGALTESDFERTLQPKVAGLRNILASVRPDALRLLVTFSSIIARCGLPGEADYAFANEWLSRLTEEFAREHPDCRCLALEWSVWSGVGMGERLGRIESLIQNGISPIACSEGVELLGRLVNRPPPAVALVLAGRFGELRTLPLEMPELPFLRFLERPLLHYPGVELIVEARLSSASDPYAEDHLYGGERLFPGVLGLEAMAQAAMAACGSQTPPDFADVELHRPIILARSGETRIRIAALVHTPERVEVTVRCESTGFEIDHFHALCLFTPGSIESWVRGEASESGASPRSERACVAREEPRDFESCTAEVDPRRDVYGDLLFHTGRFRRIESYTEIQARRCRAILAPPETSSWFGPYHPPRMVLGDAGARDAGIHAIQVCVPHARLLPVGVARIRRDPNASEAVRVSAVERHRTGIEYTYDVVYEDAEGRPVEFWSGLRLRQVESLKRTSPWPLPLLVNWVERRCAEWFREASLVCALRDTVALRRDERTLATVRERLGQAVDVGHRPDGVPEVIQSLETDRDCRTARSISAAHSDDWTLVVTGDTALGCDLEVVTERSEGVWSDMLGTGGLRLAQRIAAERPENLDSAATRLWSGREALKKVGARPDGAMALESISDDGWVLLRSGCRRVATCVVSVAGSEKLLAVAVAAMADPTSLASPRVLDLAASGIPGEVGREVRVASPLVAGAGARIVLGGAQGTARPTLQPE